MRNIICAIGIVSAVLLAGNMIGAYVGGALFGKISAALVAK